LPVVFILGKNTKAVLNMGYAEALKDGIEIVRTRNKYCKWYKVYCSTCNAEMLVLRYDTGHEYNCPACKEQIKLEQQNTLKEYQKEQQDWKLEKAITKIRCQGNKLEHYEHAIEQVKKVLYKKGCFDSTEEVIAALVLLRNRIKFNHQVKIGAYRADFVLPDEKIVLEIDGTLYHTDKTIEREQKRDDFIILSLGFDWEVIRITDEHINKNARQLVRAIKAIRHNRQKQRRVHNGYLPDNYSKHAK